MSNVHRLLYLRAACTQVLASENLDFSVTLPVSILRDTTDDTARKELRLLAIIEKERAKVFARYAEKDEEGKAVYTSTPNPKTGETMTRYAVPPTGANPEYDAEIEALDERVEDIYSTPAELPDPSDDQFTIPRDALLAATKDGEVLAALRQYIC